MFRSVVGSTVNKLEMCQLKLSSCRNRILPAHLTRKEDMENLIEAFKKKIRYEGRGYKWFLAKYLPNTAYSNLTTQINGFTPLTDRIKEAIEKYLKEGD